MTTKSDGNNLNGSVDLLASAMRDVFAEAMQSNRNGMKADMKDMEGRLEAKIDGATETTNKNVQAQLAQHRTEIARSSKA